MGLLTRSCSHGTALAGNDVRGVPSPEWMKTFVHGQPSPEFVQRLEAVREVLTSKGRTLAQGSLGCWASRFLRPTAGAADSTAHFSRERAKRI